MEDSCSSRVIVCKPSQLCHRYAHILQLEKSFALCVLIFPTVKWGQLLIYDCNMRSDSLMHFQHILCSMG